MTRARVFPHQRLGDDALYWGPWMVSRDGAPAVRVEDRVESWDYTARLGFGLTVDVEDRSELETSIGCPVTDLDVVVLVDCPASGLRFHASAALSDLDAGTPLLVDVPPGQLADRVRLSAHVVLNRIQSPEGNRATRPGARLAETPGKVVVLEGDVQRFPTEAVSFSALRLERAAWTVRLRFSSLQDSFVGSVRLLVNTDHPAASTLLDVTSSGSTGYHSYLRLDVARQLILAVAMDRALDMGESVESGTDDGSLRSGLEAMCETFLSMDLPSAVQVARQDPARLERSLQAGVEFLEDVVR